MSVAQGIGVGERQAEDRTPPDDDEARPVGRRRATPYLLLLPGMAWLAVFFVVPLLTLLVDVDADPARGAEIGVYTQTFRLANYPDAISEYFEVSSSARSSTP